MPGTICSVAVCNNNWSEVKKKKLDISFHRFPKDPKLREIWKLNCHRKDNWTPNSSYVCSQHFKERYFVKDLQAQLMGEKRRRHLTKDAIPTENIKKCQKKTTTFVQPELLECTVESWFVPSHLEEEEEHKEKIQSENKTKMNSILLDNIVQLKNENNSLKKQLIEKDKIICALNSKVKRLTKTALIED